MPQARPLDVNALKLANKLPFDPCDSEATEPFNVDAKADTATSSGEKAAGKEEKKPTQAERLTELASDADLFRTAEGEGYATVPVVNHMETARVRSGLFRDWLTLRFMESEGKPPGGQALEEALRGIEARARLQSPERRVHLRVGEDDNALWLDLGDPEWRAVKVTADGWKIVTKPPVRFRRAKGMLALPDPKQGGSVDELRPFVNVANDDDFRLLVAFLVGALHPDGPYPLLELQGEQGSAKSTTARVLRHILDPNAVMDRKPPREEQDLAIACSSNRILSIDNMSSISVALSDALARVSTGGGFGTRKLYTDDEESLFYARRPVILNGIDELIVRGDLRERAIILRLPPISSEKRMEERTFWQALNQVHPHILGALLTAVSAALCSRSKIVMKTKPRMADFAGWIVAAEPGLGWKEGSFMAAYTATVADAAEAGIEGDPVAAAIRGLGMFDGSAGELLDKLNAARADGEEPRGWPTGPRRLRSQLTRLAPNLRAVGLNLVFGKRRIAFGQGA